MPKVSVIVPIYNVEKYIKKCVKSLFEQTLDDIEYIFVDDCSPDGSVEIVQKLLLEYPNRFFQVKILRHQSNMKQHIARQTGIEAATGDYVIHCDPDDTVELDMYKKLYDFAVSGDYDYVWCDYNRISDQGKVLCSQKCDISEKVILNNLIVGKIMGSLWNRLVKREIVQEISIVHPVSPFTEDLVWVIQYTLRSKQMGYLNEPLYNYWVREDSITNSLEGNHIELILRKLTYASENLCIIEQVLRDTNYYNLISDSMVKLKFYYKQMLISTVVQCHDCEIWKRVFPEVNLKLFFCKQIPFRSKIQSFLLLCNIYPKVIHYLKS